MPATHPIYTGHQDNEASESLWAPASPEHRSPYSIFTKEIKKSENDRNSYRLLRLGNSVEVLLVSNPDLTWSGVSLAVSAGVLDDPVDIPGLAHLVEHCLITSLEPRSKTYTKSVRKPYNGHQSQSSHCSENFMSYAIKKGGTISGAQTESQQTIYSYDIAPQFLLESLGYFSNLFDPSRINPGRVGKEVLSVESEFKQADPIEPNRLWHLTSLLSRPGARHAHRFRGNFDSLTRHNAHTLPTPLDSREDSYQPLWNDLNARVHEWYQKTYLSSRVAIAVAGQESLDKLSKYVSDYFRPLAESISPRDAASTNLFQSPWAEEDEAGIIYVLSITKKFNMVLQWVVPWDGTQKTSGVASHFGHILHSRSPGSLCDTLLRMKWITYIGGMFQGGDTAEGFAYYQLTITLTDDGWKSWKDVFAVICDYMALIKAAPSAALEEIMQERAQMDEKEYYFRNSSIHALDATVRAMLAPYPRSDILTGPSLCPPLNAEDLRTWIDSYIRPGKVKVLLCGGRNWLDVGTTQPDETWSVAPGFGTKYEVSRLDDNIITANYTAERALARGMGLPAPNPFVPTDFSILPVDIDASLDPYSAVNAVHAPSRRLWYKQDRIFRDPRVYVYLELRSPTASQSIKSQACTAVLGQVIKRNFEKIAHQARLSGYWVDSGFCADNITFQVLGHRHKVPDILREYIGIISDDDPFRGSFSESLAECLRVPGERTSAGESRAREMLSKVLCDHLYPAKAVLQAMHGISERDVQASARKYMQDLDVKMIVYGNTNREAALDAYNTCAKMAPSQRPPWRNFQPPLRVPQGCNYIVDIIQPQDAGPASFHYYCDVGCADDIYARAFVRIATGLIGQEILDALVKAHQLGYDCEFNFQLHLGRFWFTLVCRASPHDPAFIERCVDAYLADVAARLRKMDADAWDELVDPMILGPVSAPPNFREHMLFFHRAMKDSMDGRDPFFDLKALTSVLKVVDADDLADFIESTMGAHSPLRRKLSIRYSPERRLSEVAVEDITDEPRLRGYNLDGTELLSKTLQEGLQILDKRLPDSVSRQDIERIVRCSAELYPAYASPENVPIYADQAAFVFMDDLESLRNNLRASQDGECNS